jgi:ABC-type nickel/cobalt efflux system permease component RcnA
MDSPLLAHGFGALDGSQRLPVVLAVAFVLGLRHAADPDHLVAVSTVVAGVRDRAARAAAVLGAAWGAGHGTTLLLFGLPVIVFHGYVPASLETVAEMLVGTIIVALGVRLLVRWRRGAFHVHEHEHEPDGRRHRHVHAHRHGDEHAHRHRVRTPAQAYAIGLVHGAAGSGAVTVLLLAALPTRAMAAMALVVVVLGTAVSMTMLSTLAGQVLGAPRMRRTLGAAIPLLGAGSLAFGAWYAAAALLAI